MAKIVAISDPPEFEDLQSELSSDEEKISRFTEREIIEKYERGQSRIVTQRNDFLIPNILQMLKDREIFDLAPSYQRRVRWSHTKQSHLIESLLMNIPVPPIFLYERVYAKYEVMDGQQRLSAIRDFWNNEFELQDLKKWPELNGKRWSDLPKQIQAGLERRGLAAVIILTESSQDEIAATELRQYVFERLNTGGETLNPQEVRNCIYSSDFNEALIRIARSDLFAKAWGIPTKESGEPQKVSALLSQNKLYSTMADCEIVLRFFALSDLTKFRGGMKRTLDGYMNGARTESKNNCKQLEKTYLSAIKVATDIYGDSLFRLPNKATKLLTGRRSVPLADAILLAIKKMGRKAKDLVLERDEILKQTLALLATEDTYEALVGRGNTKAAIEKRIDVMYRMLSSVIK